MKELEIGEHINIGDVVKVGKGTFPVFKVTEDNAYVQLNKRSTLKLPRVYTLEFKNSDPLDETSYEVFHG